MKKKIILIIDHEEGRLSEASMESAAFAGELEKCGDYHTEAVFPGSDHPQTARDFARNTGMDVTIIGNVGTHHYSAEAYIRALREVLPIPATEFIVLAHNARGCDFAPALAAYTGLGCVTGVEKVFREGEDLFFRRSVWHGKLREKVPWGGRPAVLTVMPGFYTIREPAAVSPGEVASISVTSSPSRTIAHPPFKIETEDAAISGAEVIVAAGNGVKSPETMELVRSLARLFPRSAVAGSRIACDRGLVDYGVQIGSTGKTVSPRLYIACGISGSLQHVAGMKGSETIVAINSDPGAPIFHISHLGIVDELEQFIPALLDAAAKD